MSRSVLLQLARDSIQEVFEAQNTIDKSALLLEHPLLQEKINLVVNIFINNELIASYESKGEDSSTLINNIITGAKKAAFESGEVMTTSEYLHSEIELVLDTPDGKISQRDKPIIA